MFEYECSGKNVEKAISEGLSKLKLERDNVDIKILDTGGFFKKAKVILKIPKEIYNNSEEIKKLITLNNIEKKAENAPRIEEVKEKESLNQVITTLSKNNKTENIKPENIKTEIKQETEVKSAKVINDRNNTATQQEISPQTNKTNTGNQIESNENQLEECKKFLEDLCNISKFKGTVKGSETEEEVFLNLEGENLSKLVGYKGQCLSAIQLILSAICSKYKNRKKIILDVDGYKEKRKFSLEGLANRMAKKVLETKEKVFLQPMTAYERRIIHSIIQEYPELKSSSSGQEPYRILTIDIKK